MSKSRKSKLLAIQEFAAHASAYCRLIEDHRKLGQADFLTRLHGVLSKLYAHATELPTVDTDEELDDEGMTHKDWKKLFFSLGKKCGRYGSYWRIFNPYVDDERVAGDLPDDLADIYRDLKPGLDAYLKGEKKMAAAWNWQFLFVSHWGRHAIGALGALQELNSEHRLGE